MQPLPTTILMAFRRGIPALVAACALVAAGCGGSAGSGGVQSAGEPISFEQLSQSASTSAEATTGRFSFDLSSTFPGADEPLALDGEGAFDTVNERASFTVDMSSLAKLIGGFVAGSGGAGTSDLDFDGPDGWKFELVTEGAVGYVRLPAIDDQLPEGKSWVRGTAGDLTAGGFDLSELDSVAQNDPRDVLEALQGLGGDIENVGTDELRGVETTHYRAHLDPADLVERAAANNADAASLFDRLSGQSGVTEIPLDIWIDGSGLVRKLSLDVEAPDTATGQTGHVSLAFELWDYGEPVDIEVPPASQVADASALRG